MPISHFVLCKIFCLLRRKLWYFVLLGEDAGEGNGESYAEMLLGILKLTFDLISLFPIICQIHMRGSPITPPLLSINYTTLHKNSRAGRARSFSKNSAYIYYAQYLSLVSWGTEI